MIHETPYSMKSMTEFRDGYTTSSMTYQIITSYFECLKERESILKENQELTHAMKDMEIELETAKKYYKTPIYYVERRKKERRDK